MGAGPMLNFGRCRLGASEISTRAADLVLGTTVVDMLGLLTLDWSLLARWQSDPRTFDEADFRRLEATGVAIFHPAVETNSRDPRRAAIRWTGAWKRLVETNACFLAPAGTVGDLVAARRRGRLGIVIGFQNSSHFLSAVDVAGFHARGQRVSQLTYNDRNRLGSGCYARRDRGLTRLGAAVVGEMNRVGMAIDVSHCGERTTLEAIGLSRRPVLVTHSNCAALVPGQPRCKSDAVIRALAAGGGVFGITLVRAFVGRSDPTIDDVLDHFEHVARLVGPEHVGLGSDLDADAFDPATGRVRPPYAIRGIDPSIRAFQLADGLLGRGFGRDDVERMLGGNFLRALAANWPTPAAPPSVAAARRDPFCPAPRRLPPETG